MAKKDLPTVMTRTVYHDGDKIVHVEDTKLRLGMAWKQLQSTIANHAGLATHQIGLYIVSGDPDVAAADPVTHKLPPDAIFFDQDCYLLALIHGSPTRNQRRRRLHSPEKPTPERILLRRDPPVGGCYSPSSAQVGAMRLPDDALMAQFYQNQGAALMHPDIDVAMAHAAYQARAAMYASDDASTAQFLKYRSSMANSQQFVSPLRSAPYNSGRAIPNNENISVCEVCRKAKRGAVTEFHPCKNEKVLAPTEWRGDFGPIGKAYLR